MWNKNLYADLISAPLSATPFVAIEKLIRAICQKIMKNTRIQKLLFYSDKRALGCPELSEEQVLDLFGKNIRIIPYLEADYEKETYITIIFDKVVPTGVGDSDYAYSLTFAIFASFDQWQLEDMRLRPYAIASELETMFGYSEVVNGLTAEFQGIAFVPINENLAGINCYYTIEAIIDKTVMKKV